ncbi:MAG TPA: ABC transporter ATP-binding protein [Firmicutes bacterium]|nr:ABC transporter ATP-binding protein [Bacillota bacterium]
MSYYESAISLENVTKTYGRRWGQPGKTVVNNVTFDVSHGELMGLLGPNGSGKTTIIKMLVGLVTLTHGAIRIKGVDITSSRARALAALGVMSGDARSLYWRLSCYQNLEYFGALRTGLWGRKLRDRIGSLLEAFGLSSMSNTPAGDLSRGLLQRLGLAVALVSDPEILILDEPTSGLDVVAIHELVGFLRELSRRGRTILIATHDMSFAERLVDRICIIQGGYLVALDRVSHLSRLLRTRCYELSVDGSIDEIGRDAITSFKGVALSETRDGLKITFDAEDVDELYELLDFLRQRKVGIKDLLRREPDLEQAYLRIIGKS